MSLPYVFYSALIVFTSIHSSISQRYRSSNIELDPPYILLNSTSFAEFYCINHQPKGVPLEVQLSKNISQEHLQLSIDPLNVTTISIRLQLSDYVGTFQLFCHEKGQQSRGTRADVTARTELGVIRLVKRCEVHERQYIKCRFRAPNIARSIRNGFPSDFEFSENSKQPVYRKTDEILANESTEEYLTFQWTPLVDGQFPAGVKMMMKISLPSFDTLNYRFDMTPLFLIKPHFTLQRISSKQIQLQLTPSSPPADCQRSGTSKGDSKINRTWIPIQSDSKAVLINNPPYQLCVRCRQTLTDPFGTEECQETPMPKTIFRDNIITIIIVIVWFIILVVFVLIYFLVAKKPEITVDTPADKEVSIVNDAGEERYRLFDKTDLINNQNDSE